MEHNEITSKRKSRNKKIGKKRKSNKQSRLFG